MVHLQLFSRTVWNLSQPPAIKRQEGSKGFRSGPEAIYLLSEEVVLLTNGVLSSSKYGTVENVYCKYPVLQLRTAVLKKILWPSENRLEMVYLHADRPYYCS